MSENGFTPEGAENFTASSTNELADYKEMNKKTDEYWKKKDEEEKSKRKQQLENVLDPVRTVETRRGFDDYMYILDIKPEDLGGKVLDLGSGMNEAFSKEAKAHGIEVTSVNPKLLKPEIAEEAKSVIETPDGQKIGWQEKSVAAMSGELPFKDGSFDSIVAVESVPGYLDDTDEEYLKTFSEMARVLKEGGTAFINDVTVTNEHRLRYDKIAAVIKDKYDAEISFPDLEEKGDTVGSTRIMVKRGS